MHSIPVVQAIMVAAVPELRECNDEMLSQRLQVRVGWFTCISSSSSISVACDGIVQCIRLAQHVETLRMAALVSPGKVLHLQ